MRGRCVPGRHKKQDCYPIWYSSLLRAGDGTRTRDILLGRQTLYQLSYARVICVSARTFYHGINPSSNHSAFLDGSLWRAG